MLGSQREPGRLSMKPHIFWIFGVLQSLSLGIIIFLIFRSLNLIKEAGVVGLDFYRKAVELQQRYANG